ncbi:hypothetical protein DL96DRAFT_1597687 [Flagelloscypha sp. PMI_526]|nr:hypothetical protein DL96DRAFT_1597687 [Flagelloscypha sp. PMI_526]
MTMRGHCYVSLFSTFFLTVAGQDDWARWCGKHYQQGSPYDIPVGQFVYPELFEQPLFNFQCWPGRTPYLFTEDDAEFIVDAPLSHEVGFPFTSTNTTRFSVHLALDENSQSIPLASKNTLQLNSTGISVPFRLQDLGEARKKPFQVTCTAIFEDGQSYTSNTSVKFLPENPNSESTTGIDHWTSSMVVYHPESSSWDPIIPFGFYTNFDGWLAPNRTTMIPQIKAWGHNMIHPVPTFSNISTLLEVIDIMEEQGLYLMYDMRWTYKNLTAVEGEVNRIKSYKNLLLCKGYNRELDGWHPVSLVLNCENYFFKEYTDGANSRNLKYSSFSSVYNTSCDKNYGDCGCDNCKGSFKDITTRIDTFSHRRSVIGRTRSMPLWDVPQAFGDSAWWPREPTGAELLLMILVSLNHGAMGIVPWDHNVGSTADQMETSALFGTHLDILTPYLTGRHSERKVLINGDIDVGLWKGKDGTMLVMVGNTEYSDAAWQVEVGYGSWKKAQLLFRNAETTKLGILPGGRVGGTIGAVGSGAWILQK